VTHGDEERLELLANALRQDVHVVIPIVLGKGRDDAIVTKRRTILLLSEAHDADRTRGDDDARPRRRIEDHHGVERVTVWGARTRNEPPIVRTEDADR
jgi:hypothetical protein